MWRPRPWLKSKVLSGRQQSGGQKTTNNNIVAGSYFKSSQDELLYFLLWWKLELMNVSQKIISDKFCVFPLQKTSWRSHSWLRGRRLGHPGHRLDGAGAGRSGRLGRAGRRGAASHAASRQPESAGGVRSTQKASQSPPRPWKTTTLQWPLGPHG